MSDFICVLHDSEACWGCIKEMQKLEEELSKAKEQAERYRALVSRATHIVGCVTDGSAVHRWITDAEAALNQEGAGK